MYFSSFQVFFFFTLLCFVFYRIGTYDCVVWLQNLERQLEGQRPLLADAEAAGAQLCEVLSDPASRSEIQAKLSAVGRQYNTLQKKLDHRKAEIEGSLRY